MSCISEKSNALLVEVSKFYRGEVERGVQGERMLAEVNQYLQELNGKAVLPDRALAPVVVQLQETAEQTCAPRIKRVLDAFLDLEPNVQWQRNSNYTADRIGEYFLENYGFCNIIGPGGFYETDRVQLGFLLLGPGAYYPKHFHPALEMYHPVCGEAFWSQEDGAEIVHPSGTAVYHGENVIHTMRTADQPLLALYCWLDGIEAQAEMKIAV